jgi:multiple sugar transport system substrate-binding protein
MNLARPSVWRVLWYIVCSIVALLFLAPILWSFLTSFKVPSEANATPPQLVPKDTISFWVRDSDQAVADPLVKTYNAKGDGTVKLTIIPAGQFVTKFATSIAGGSPPDVVATDLIYVPAFAAAQNRLYSVPFSAEASVLVYNKALFRQAKLDPERPPSNFAEFENAAKQITELGGDIKGFYFSGSASGGMVFTSFPLIWASGGDVLSADGSQATVDTPAMRETLALYRRVWQGKLVPEVSRRSVPLWFFNPDKPGTVRLPSTT